MGGRYEPFVPRYDLVASDVDLLEKMVTTYTGINAPEAEIVGLVVPTDAEIANFGRTGEQGTFRELGEDYDFKEGMAPHEPNSTFLYTIDQRDCVPEPRIIHVKRMVSPNTGGLDTDGFTGIEMIDDRLVATDVRESMDLDELLAASGLTMDGLKQVINVATNYRTRRGEREHNLKEIGTLLSYHFLVEHGDGSGAKAILAYLNRAAAMSLGFVGAEKRLLGGKEFHLPKTNGGYDTDYTAQVIPGSAHNLDIFLGRDPSGLVGSILKQFRTKLLHYKNDTVAK